MDGKAGTTAAVARPRAEGLSSHMAPDDSDLMDAPLAVPEERHAAPGPAPSSSATRLVQPLIPVSTRFWFGVFAGDLPDVDMLNENDGLAAAQLPADLADGAAPRKLQWFCIDEDLVYLSFSNDWGPLNIAMFYRFCVHVHQMLMDPAMAGQHLALYTSTHPHTKANAALLCALYAMTIDHLTPADAFHPYSCMEFMPFRDAGYGRADYSLTIQDILYGMRRALDHDLLDLTTFDLESYEYYEQVQHGDWNWITPQFLAFASPKDKAYMASLAAAGPSAAAAVAARMPLNPALRSTVEYFQRHKVGLVVRLNNALYHRSAFEKAGIEHKDLYFDDGSNPSDEILRTFLRDADRVINAGRTIAVHCKAGLGRTGVLIGAYLIYKYGFTASEAIGFMRLMRPGCVVGPQQHFMYEQATTWVRWGVEDHLRAELQREATAASAVAQPAATVTETTATATTATATAATAPTAAAPATPPDAAPAAVTKPIPCVGQPRKSPSPKRRRVTPVGGVPPASDEPAAAPRRVASDEQDTALVAKLLSTPSDAAAPSPAHPTPRADRAANARRVVSASTPRRAMSPAQPAAAPPRARTFPPTADSPAGKPTGAVAARPGAENRPPTRAGPVAPRTPASRSTVRTSPRARP